MRTERQKMLAGELYDPFDPELVAARARARDLCQALNALSESEQDGRRRILEDLFGTGGDTVWMQPPFFCDYGTNIHLGTRCSSTSNAPCSMFARFASATTRCLARAYNPDAFASARPQTAENAGVRQANRDRRGRLGRRRGPDPDWRSYRTPDRRRSGQRRNARSPRRRLRGRKPLPGHSQGLELCRRGK